MTRCLRVVEEGGEKPKLLPLEDDNTLLLGTLSSIFPGATGLEFSAPAESADVYTYRFNNLLLLDRASHFLYQPI